MRHDEIQHWRMKWAAPRRRIVGFGPLPAFAALAVTVVALSGSQYAP
jgi:hypothetical protein